MGLGCAPVTRFTVKQKIGYTDLAFRLPLPVWQAQEKPDRRQTPGSGRGLIPAAMLAWI